MPHFYYDAAYLCSSVAFMYSYSIFFRFLFFSQNICWLEAEGTGVLILITLSSSWIYFAGCQSQDIYALCKYLVAVPYFVWFE
jgi:hypothetical protein